MPHAIATPGASEFWSLRETIRSEQASLDRIFLDNGRRSRGKRDDPAYLSRFAEAAEFLADVLDGNLPSYRLAEALSTSDFPVLMGDILDRQLLAKYNEVPVTWPNYARRATVRDFRQVRRVAVDGLEGSYYPSYQKSEHAEVREDNNLSETNYAYNVEVYEKAVSLNWRMLINDDLQAFQDLPDRLARGARRTEERFATQLFVDANGPHASLYTSGNKNLINATNSGTPYTAVNPPFSIAGLQQGFAVMSKMLDANGEPIVIESVELVVPPGLEIPARNILNATELWVGGDSTAANNNLGGGAQEQSLHVANWMRSRLRLSVNPYIPIIATTNGNTSWFMFANPDQGRPALEIGFLRGYENPSLFQKDPDMRRIGAGVVDPALGDFETGEIRYKGMHIIGGTRMDAKMTVASNGSGS
jgi:hypothetical protein